MLINLCRLFQLFLSRPARNRSSSRLLSCRVSLKTCTHSSQVLDSTEWPLPRRHPMLCLSTLSRLGCRIQEPPPSAIRKVHPQHPPSSLHIRRRTVSSRGTTTATRSAHPPRLHDVIATPSPHLFHLTVTVLFFSEVTAAESGLVIKSTQVRFGSEWRHSRFADLNECFVFVSELRPVDFHTTSSWAPTLSTPLQF